ncbi:hypothetical protein KPL78_22915 [Roseomonas sp. HJA6]|uniref:Uncharacterized protein n=1 Tax=Roseomonas alba TaxID=2846776 RepID=A0ABS7AHD2_9PROT|nr:hypothetical protein [Neoroseomonas alba]MBW6400730.1 hypothetical protein [Neoroseomonas alba]
MRRIGAIVAMGLLGVLARPVVAQQLDPQVAMPLMQLIQAAGAQCQMGNQQACALVPQLQQAGNELMQAQFGCQQGNPQACQMFQAGAQQVMMVWQQNFGGNAMPQATQPYSPQQQAWDHQQRMQQQQMLFQQQQQQYQQQQRQNDIQHQRFMETLRR